MPYKIFSKRGDWLVQVQRAGIRKTKRGTGGEQVAKRAEALLIAELDQGFDSRKPLASLASIQRR